MRRVRRRVSAPLSELNIEIDRLLRLDAANQLAFSSGAGKIDKHTLFLLSESIYFAAFRAYEAFVEDVFLLYCLEKPTRKGKLVRSYLRPRDFEHAASLIKSSMKFLEWTSPAIVIERAETYLNKGFPIKTPYTVNKETLSELKKLRNHIAHNSRESFLEYKKVLTRHYRTIPLVTPSTGEFLLRTNPRDKTKYNLVYYLEFLKNIANSIT